MNLYIRKCRPDELPAALGLLYQAAVWLRDKNIDYWQNWLDPPASHVDWIRQGFERGEFHFVYNGEHALVGMYRLQYVDEMFWGKRNDRAGYIHSFTTNRELRGNGIGYFILNAIEKELSRDGYAFLRLDCSPDIEGLCKYYEGYGFRPKGTILLHGEKLRLYEKELHT